MRFRGLSGLLLLAIVLLFVLPSAAGFYTDWLWFRSLGYEHVFLRSINAQATVFVATFVAVFLFLYLNLRIARRHTSERLQVVLGRGADGQPIAVEGRRLAGLALPAAVLVALALGLMEASNWLTWLQFFNGVPFGRHDTLFGRDIAFYVFRLPIYQTIRELALVVSVLALIGCAVYYVFSGSFVIEAQPGVASWPRIRLRPSARRHLSLLAAFVLGLMAWGAWLEIPGTLLSSSTPTVGYGASYTDVYANIPFLWAGVVTLVIGAGLAIWHGFGRRGWPIPLAIALYIVVSAAGGVYAGFVQRFVVTPNEQDKERPYIEHNIEGTRLGYGVDTVDERPLSGDAELTAADIIQNAGTIENVRLWDHEPLLQTFSQIQEIRTYYDFVSVDNDRYMIDGRYRQVMLSARELNTENMPNRSWVNERLTFTHGYGLTLGPVNQVTTEGLPVLFIRDLPPVSTVNLRLDKPSIYYGELSSNYVIVRTRQPEFDYPKGDDNAYSSYDGTGGVPIGSLWRRLLFALRFGSTDILVTNQITRESRIMLHRQITDRVRTIAPFLTLDADPYPVVSGGRIFWIQDAYTTTDNYPYSTPRQSPEFNYIRNSVKIVIDAFNGSVRFYQSDPEDPLARTIARIFPGLLEPMSKMPADLRQHVRYPEDLFRIQAAVYSTYHMTNPGVFYNKEDQWQVPSLDSGGQNNAPMPPYYTIMTLPGEQRPEFIQMLPFSPRAKDNLSAWMVARSDGPHYGHLVVFQFPKQKIVYGPRQIVGRINQDQVISPQITLWGQQGSEVRWGNLLVIPIKESLIYVRPLYLRSPERGIPELKRVVVAYQSRIVMADTLIQALGQIFGRGVETALAPDQLESSATSVVQTAVEPNGPSVPAPTTADTTPETQDLAGQALEHYQNAQQALKDGDWARYGDEMKQVGDLLQQMQDAATSTTGK